MLTTLLAFSIVLGDFGNVHAVRLWFSTSGVAEQQPIEGLPSEFISPMQGINPALGADAGLTRLYLWGSLHTFGWWWFIAPNVEIETHTGLVRIADSWMYNYQASGVGRRWSTIGQGTRTDASVRTIILSAGYGIERGMDTWDLQTHGPTVSLLLGYVDLESSPDARASIYITQWGPMAVAGNSPVEAYFGWGDAPLGDLDWDVRTALPDATIVPEPAAAAGALLGAVVLVRSLRRPKKDCGSTTCAGATWRSACGSSARVRTSCRTRRCSAI